MASGGLVAPDFRSLRLKRGTGEGERLEDFLGDLLLLLHETEAATGDALHPRSETGLLGSKLAR